jgi:YegS/Rv2252/BmrU family lipid kinase
MRICVIFNPAARGDKARRFRARLDDIARQAALKLTQGPGDARRLAAEAVAEGFDLVVAAGGDGTVNEVLNGLALAPDGFARAALGLLPLGTVNVFARELGLPRRLGDDWAVIQRGRLRAVDVVFVETGGAQSCFCQLAGAGLDARAIERLNWPLKKRIGPLAYVWAGLGALAEKQPQIIVRANGIEQRGELVLLGNGRRYGGNFQLFPAAQLDDGLVDVCVFPRASVFTLLRCAAPLLLRGRLPEAAVQRLRASRLTLEGASAFELDGELAGRLPATVRVESRRLRVVGP